MTSEELAKRIRFHAIKMVNHAHASHIGGILSCADIVAVLYSEIARIYPHDPENESRDRIILSKGHNGVAIYAALAECGFFNKELLKTYGDNGSCFSCHISHRHVPGVEISTGSLGQGVGVACGMALNGKLKHRSYQVYAIVGDGECNEGAIWEMASFASHQCLDNFTVIVDRNRMQAMGWCEDVLKMEPFQEKWRAFGWHVVNVIDGNNHKELKRAFSQKSNNNKPRVIIANTVKGKGISFMENQLLWHYRDPQGEDYFNALKELE
ncbi:transketolase [Megasphaera stantonii]|uniref:Transketolase n=1 Tax=Megasphaera stantonii TaxID=2144175 RepID=A0A346B1U0_9FIRM|nr:transketolase [Megasphaera stantonii]AXL22083.1 transketolase [Megasphaera stantonii]